ncbi:hypothetical protein CF326_g7023 [Tilletia indica]|nr:hypothetical protein CF326_g7023 [Tilletia indica]
MPQLACGCARLAAGSRGYTRVADTHMGDRTVIRDILSVLVQQPQAFNRALGKLRSGLGSSPPPVAADFQMPSVAELPSAWLAKISLRGLRVPARALALPRRFHCHLPSGAASNWRTKANVDIVVTSSSATTGSRAPGSSSSESTQGPATIAPPAARIFSWSISAD